MVLKGCNMVPETELPTRSRPLRSSRAQDEIDPPPTKRFNVLA